MKGSQREEFRRFVTGHTSELFEVAYAAAGRQDRAERLLQSALERLALRWRRATDPYAYVTRLVRRGALPWWRRWTGLGDLPPVAEGPGGRGRPVDLGELALAGARRRRLVRAGAAAAVPVVLAGAALLVAGGDGGGGGGGDGGGDNGPVPTVDLAGLNVVTSYYDRGTYVLNPDTGEYDFWTREPGVISPDLRLTASFTAGSVVVRSTTTGEVVYTVTPDLPVGTVAWSPDGGTLAVTSADRDPRRLHLVDSRTGQGTDVEIGFADDRAVWSHPFAGVYWLDNDHLAVPTVDTTVHVDPGFYPPEFLPTRLTGQVPVAVSVVDRAGTVLRELPLDNDGLGPERAWMPSGLVRDGRHLLLRRTDQHQLEVAAVDLTATSGPYPAVEVPVAEIPRPASRTMPYGPWAWPSAWLADGPVVIGFSFPYSSGLNPSEFYHQLILVGLSDGHVGSCIPPQGDCDAAQLAGLLDSDLPVPPTATLLTFAPAATLPAPAARLAF